MLWGLILAFGGIVIALFGRMLLQQQIVTLIGVLASISGMFFIAATPFLRRTRSNKRGIHPSTQPEVLAPAEPTRKLPPMSVVDYIPSVTEDTTELLKDPASNYPNSSR